MLDKRLPSDVLVSIFYRLSVKEVIRCSSIKKSFYKLIHSNPFINAYNRQSQLYASNHPLILVQFDDGVKFSLHYESNNKELDECVPLPSPFPSPQPDFTLVSCCDSLVCLCDFVGKQLILWNPYIRKCLTLPKPYLALDDPVFGVGCVDQTSDYKVLNINCTNQAQLYSLRHNCWKIIANPKHFDIALQHPVCVKGSFYWISSKTDSCVMGVFDLKDEVFAEIRLPYSFNDVDVDALSLKVKKHTESSIAVVWEDSFDDEDGDTYVMDVMNEEKKWRKYSSKDDDPHWDWDGRPCKIYSNKKGKAIVQRELVRDSKRKGFVGFGYAYKYVNNLALFHKAGESSTPSKSRKTGESSTPSKSRKTGESSTPSKRRKTGDSSTRSKKRKTRV